MEVAQIWRERYNQKKTYSRLAGYVFQNVQITTEKIKLEKKGTVVWPSVENWKKLHRKKRYSRLVVSWRTSHKTQHTS
jgi:hypothetical protein